MRTEQIKIYKFEELSKEAQERAKEIVLNDYHEFGNTWRYEDIIDNICENIEEKLGLEFQYKDFDWDLEYCGRLNFEDTDRLANELIGKYEKNLKVEDDGSGNRRIGWKRKDGKDFMVLFLPNPKQKDPYFRHDWIARNENNFRIEFKTKSQALAYAKQYMRKN